jgi:hypothetical protein
VKGPSPLARHLAAPLLLAALTAALYFPVQRLFFTKDDPAILAHVVDRGVASGFTSPEAWQAHNRLFFTPLLNASLGADLALFGLRAGPFYAHHLASIALAGVLFYLLLARTVPAAIAAFAAAAFVSGAPVGEVATQLMSRHYVEGLVLSLAAALAWGATDGPPPGRLREIAAALLCVLASAAKEVFLPLPLFLLLVTPSRRRDASRVALLAATLGASLAWRVAMLGVLGRSYAPGQLSPRALLGNAGSLAAALPEALFGLSPAASALVLALLLAGSLAWVRDRARLARVLGAAALFAGPVLPVAAWLGIGSRYVLVGWALLVALAALSAAALWERAVAGRAGAVVVLGALAVGAVPGGRDRFDRSLGEAGRESAEGRFFLASGSGDVLRDPVAPFWYFRGLARLRPVYGPAGAPGVVVNDASYLCGTAGAAARVHVSAPEGVVVPETAREAAARAAACRNVVEGPLPASISFDRGLLEWELGPPADGSWGLVFLVPAFRFDVPRAGRHYLQWPPFGKELAVRVRHVSDAGVVTYGPEMRAPLVDGRARVAGGTP